MRLPPNGRGEEGRANIRLLKPTRPVRRPAEHGEWARADLAFHATVLLDHLNERVVRCGEAVIADSGEVRDFGAAAVYVGFGAGRGHCSGRLLGGGGLRWL